MLAVVRNYGGSGAKELFDLLEERKAEVDEIIGEVPGLVSYSLIRTAVGGVSITVCQDQSGIDESVRIAAEWIKSNAPELGAAPPSITEGSIILQKN